MSERKHLFLVTEIGKNINEKYHMKMTDKEMSKFLKNKREFYGYIPGVGGDKMYCAIAIYDEH